MKVNGGESVWSANSPVTGLTFEMPSRRLSIRPSQRSPVPKYSTSTICKYCIIYSKLYFTTLYSDFSYLLLDVVMYEYELQISICKLI